MAYSPQRCRGPGDLRSPEIRHYLRPQELCGQSANRQAALGSRLEVGIETHSTGSFLRLDAAWYTLVERLNRTGAPDELRAVRTIVRDGYGWTEFIDHFGCEDADAAKRFFRRAGAWLALFHCFAASDMHQENMIAAGDHPVPIDLEMILQATADEQKLSQLEAQAFEAANLSTCGDELMRQSFLQRLQSTEDALIDVKE
jgi:lantibiotic modifying enzyme